MPREDHAVVLCGWTVGLKELYVTWPARLSQEISPISSYSMCFLKDRISWILPNRRSERTVCDLHACHKRFHLFLRIPCVSWKIGFREYCWTFHSLTLDFSLFSSALRSVLTLTLTQFIGSNSKANIPFQWREHETHKSLRHRIYTLSFWEFHENMKNPKIHTYIFSDETQSTTCTKFFFFFFCMTCDTSMLYIYFYGKTFMFMLDDRSFNALYKQMGFLLRLEHCHATPHSWYT